MAEQGCKCVDDAALSADAQRSTLQMADNVCICAVLAALSADAQGSALQMAEQVVALYLLRYQLMRSEVR